MTPAYPCPGCVCEYLEDNSAQIAITMEENAGKLRLLLPGRREIKLSANRLLPWLGPVYPATASKEEMLRVLDQHKQARESKTRDISLNELWEMAEGEIDHAPASWFAELVETDPDADTIAAYGRALLGCKTHFRFQPPEFLIYNQDTVAKRLEELKARQEKEAIANQGSAFLRLLWDVACKKRSLPPADSEVFPSGQLADRIQKLLMARVANPESQDDDALWRLLSKGLPDVPHLPLQMLMAWGVLPPHYNFWLDRADYARGDSWWHEFAEEVESLADAARRSLPVASDLTFVSVDGNSTIDIDDAFSIERADSGLRLTLAFACPVLDWPFGGALDKAVSHRATSIYLPEGDLHMLPEKLGTDSYSLKEGQPRPALCLRVDIEENGEVKSCEPFLASVKLAANLRYADTQQLIEAGCPLEDNPASPFWKQISLAHEFAKKREQLRVSQGAVIMLRQEPGLRLENRENGLCVCLDPEKPIRDAQRLVSEMMILASACFADWAHEHGVPMLHRTQNVALPREYAGVWERPEDLARVMRSLIPSSLELTPRPHAALGLSRYAQVTSPLRRYPDLINEAQIVGWLQKGEPRFSASALATLLDTISSALDAAGVVQKNRPRYWKLLYLRQQGDKAWHHGVITEENELFVNVSLPVENLFVRGRRNLFDERATPGMAVRIRLGNINPLANEIQIMEAMTDE